ncbi:DUF2793 domain-containing protein [Rhizobiales bacterium RZME27]|uniref:DUF2793 domain-containing protein n=1 Tax=Endobacterium cereale TaxID=2663029 RepID=A0A6A8AJL4_9HYPH|nr:DUF2793 domain-containing protein [Endobacterium cereale]MEB2842808.1 DUF2793 domain-containing protein [Endobacterium cereale]MQY49930.1 DUF2793 domain-containing protein [Endobacterium cereale]
MTDRTTNLSMPYILPSQAQKHVTHNDALQTLDAVIQLAVDGDATAPPPAPAAGARFLVAGGATDAWAGHDGHIAVWQDGAWLFAAPREGWVAWFRGEKKLKIFHDAAWSELDQGNASPTMIGINTSADDYNRLAVASQASLFTHVGQGHQAKINKATAGDTATLLFQSNWIGHAEMGLAGDNEFSIKVSDGTAWLTALKIRQNGIVDLPQRPMGRAYKNDGTVSPLPNSDSGFTILDQAHGGVALGSKLNNGDRALAVPVEGRYQLSLMATSISASGYAISLMRNKSEIIFSLWFPTAAPLTLSHTQVVTLAAGDELSLYHAGTAQIYNAAAATQLTLAML